MNGEVSYYQLPLFQFLKLISVIASRSNSVAVTSSINDDGVVDGDDDGDDYGLQIMMMVVVVMVMMIIKMMIITYI
jgi:hypothetical protein